MCLCLWVCLYDSSSPTGIITLLHFSTLSVWSKISLYSSADTGPRTDFAFHYSALIMVPNVKCKFNTKERVPGMNFKGHPILTMQCGIWLHFLCCVIDLIGSLGTNEPNTESRDEPGHFDDIILSMWDVSCSQCWEDCGLVWREWTLTLMFSVSCQRLIRVSLILEMACSVMLYLNCVVFGPLSDFEWLFLRNWFGERIVVCSEPSWVYLHQCNFTGYVKSVIFNIKPK